MFIHYENVFRYHQAAPRYKGIDQTYLMSYEYQQFGNSVRSYKHLSKIYTQFGGVYVFAFLTEQLL